MAKLNRVAPYRYKGKGRVKKVEKNNIEDIKIDSAKIRANLEVMTAEELTRVQQVAAQNALNLFNALLEELAKRIPAMNDEVLSNSLLSVWDKVGGNKK